MRGYRIAASHRLMHLDISVVFFHVGHLVGDRPLVLVLCGVGVR